MSKELKKVIVVGAGTAGSVIAKKLSPHFKVTIFDKSLGARMPLFYQVPLMIGLLFNRQTKFINRSQLFFNNERNVPFFCSNVIGGGSIINGCVHVAGNKKMWKSILSHFDITIDSLEISYDELFTKKMEKEKIHLCKSKQGELEKIFFLALKKFGINHKSTEWTNIVASTMVYNTVKRYLRSSVLDLNPFSKSKVVHGCHIERLVVDKSFKIIGVYDGKKIFFADYIILSGGVIGSNRILQTKALRVEDGVYVDLKLDDVGSGIKDHTNLRVNVQVKNNVGSLNEIDSSLFHKVKLLLKHALGLWTLMKGTGATASANLDIDGDGEVDTRINLLKFYESGRMGSGGKLFSNSSPGFSISITQINPKSYGFITQYNNDVFVKPNYLAEESDVNHLKKSLNFVINLLQADPFSLIIKKIENIDNIKKYPEKYIFENTYSGYHLIGGCAHLVSENFNINQYKNLFICDASIISEYPSSNIHAAVVILADLFAKKFIKLMQ